MTVSSTKMRQ